MIRMEEYGIPKNFFELLAQLPWEPDPRLMDLEAKLMRGDFDYNESKSLINKPFKGTKKQMKYLCDKKLKWDEIAEIFDEPVERCQSFARKNGIEKASCVGRPKMNIEENVIDNIMDFHGDIDKMLPEGYFPKSIKKCLKIDNWGRMIKSERENGERIINLYIIKD